MKQKHGLRGKNKGEEGKPQETINYKEQRVDRGEVAGDGQMGDGY